MITDRGVSVWPEIDSRTMKRHKLVAPLVYDETANCNEHVTNRPIIHTTKQTGAKISNTRSKDVVNNCQLYFHFDTISDITAKRKQKFLKKIPKLWELLMFSCLPCMIIMIYLVKLSFYVCIFRLLPFVWWIKLRVKHPPPSPLSSSECKSHLIRYIACILMFEASHWLDFTINRF